jgi:hypothetical protein
MLANILYLSFFLFSVVISIQDAVTGTVSRLWLWTALLAALLLQGVIQAAVPVAALVGGLLGVTVFFLAFFCSGRRLGLADVWYAGLMGIVLGPLWWYAAIGSACIYSLLFFAATRRRSAAFIPFMTAGSFTIIPLFLKMP